LQSYFYRNVGDESQKPVICISNHHYILSEQQTRIICGYYDVNLVSGYGINTVENIHINIIKPGQYDRKFIQKIQDEKKFWVMELFISLDELGYTIDPYEMLELTEKELFELEVNDILSMLCDPDNDYGLDSVEEAYETLLEPLILANPLKRYRMRDIQENVKDGMVTLCHTMETSVNDMIEIVKNFPAINGIVHDNILTDDQAEPLLSINKDFKLLKGSGQWIY
jgi:hypothetical protein